MLLEVEEVQMTVLFFHIGSSRHHLIRAHIGSARKLHAPVHRLPILLSRLQVLHFTVVLIIFQDSQSGWGSVSRGCQRESFVNVGICYPGKAQNGVLGTLERTIEKRLGKVKLPGVGNHRPMKGKVLLHDKWMLLYWVQNIRLMLCFMRRNICKRLLIGYGERILWL